MRYKVRRTNKAREQMDAWPVSRELRNKVYVRLFLDLPANPDGLLGEQIAGLTARLYQFTLPDDRGVPYHLHFAFAVDRRDDLSELHVIGARLTSEDTGEN